MKLGTLSPRSRWATWFALWLASFIPSVIVASAGVLLDGPLVLTAIAAIGAAFVGCEVMARRLERIR